ncbi:glycosyltransferase [Mucilaginibacter litoreus]|uniref:Glycosyltransferase n=1 Tax=Mucilaginibacter litoreus TaxID=1048221 RepID=A0ABW3ALT4_9SPHI
MANILYIGDSNPGSTSAHRAGALQRLGHTVLIKDPYKVFATSLFEPLHLRTGYRLIQGKMLKWVKSILVVLYKPDVIWVDSGELLGPDCIKLLKSYNCPVILYNVDDPTGKRDGRKFDLLLKALDIYDLVVVVRKDTEEECLKLGAKHVLRVLRSYDEVAHQPFKNYTDIPTEYRSAVAFIGTWMRREKRDELFLKLIEANIPFRIWGIRWQKSPHWEVLKPYYAGGALSGRNYVAAIQGAKVCLGLLSKGNRDLHTQRSLEIPFAGGLFCAERTSEHQEMYQEGVEAVFWSTPEECVQVCKRLLDNDLLNDTIRMAGRNRVLKNGVGNQDICKRILEEINIPVTQVNTNTVNSQASAVLAN